MRVYELAKILGLQSKKLREYIEGAGIGKNVNPSAKLNPAHLSILKEHIAKIHPELIKIWEKEIEGKGESVAESAEKDEAVTSAVKVKVKKIKREKPPEPEIPPEEPKIEEKIEEEPVKELEAEELPKEELKTEEEIPPIKEVAPEEVTPQPLEEIKEEFEEKVLPKIEVKEEEFGPAVPEPKQWKKEDIKKMLKKLEEEIKKQKGAKKPEKRKKEVFRLEDIYDEAEIEQRRQQLIKKKVKKEAKPPPKIERKQEKKVIKIEEGEKISVIDLSREIGVKVKELIKKLKELGIDGDKDYQMDYETLSIIASEYGYEVNVIEFKEEDYIDRGEAPPEEMVERAPVVTVMGHVDHGKTTLLDAIRKTNVAEGEAGHITQKIGASTVEVDGKKIVFIDTPGHEAFTAMRARGAMATDIVVLVVAADDGVMPQTIEAINHARAAKVPIVVAINKIDKPEANPMKVKQQLSEYGLVPEEWGGDTLTVEISAKTGKGLKDLLEAILLQAEMMDLKASPKRRGMGIIIESKIDPFRGPVATMIVKSGTFKEGDYVVAGLTYGRIRAMYDDKGTKVKEAGPSSAVEVLGLDSLAQAGEFMYAVESEEIAKKIVEKRKEKIKEEKESKAITTLETLFEQLKEKEIKELHIILKCDTYGSLNALEESIPKLSTEQVKINIIHKGVGNITESDVMLAVTSDGIILGFNTKIDPNAKELAKKEKVQIKIYNVIYDLLDEVKKAVEGQLAPKEVEVLLGKAEVRQIFNIPNVGKVAGCYVIEGKIVRNGIGVIKRGNNEIFRGKIVSIRRFKDDVKEVEKGYECGVRIEGASDINQGDLIECYEKQLVT